MKCKNCKSEVSKGTKICPFCGSGMGINYKTFLPIIFLVIILLFSLLFFSLQMKKNNNLYNIFANTIKNIKIENNIPKDFSTAIYDINISSADIENDNQLRRYRRFK